MCQDGKESERIRVGKVDTALVEILQVGVRETGRKPHVCRRRIRWIGSNKNDAQPASADKAAIPGESLPSSMDTTESAVCKDWHDRYGVVVGHPAKMKWGKLPKLLKFNWHKNR